jgi:hypothetical protein
MFFQYRWLKSNPAGNGHVTGFVRKKATIFVSRPVGPGDFLYGRKNP